MSFHILCLVILFALALTTAETQAPRAALERPNFILFFVDDLGYGDCGFTGHPTTQTPNIDKLAWNGKILTTWYSGCSVCSCSRAALLTGRQYGRYGMQPVLGPTDRYGLNLDEVTIAEQLKRVNYTTAIVGKYHLGQRLAYLPGNQGFDYYLGIPYSDDMGNGKYSTCSSSSHDTTKREFSTTRQQATDSGTKHGDPAGLYLPLVYQKFNRTSIIEQPLDLTTLAQKYSDFATEFIHTNKDSSFFLYVPFSHVHATTGRTCHNETLPHEQYASCQHQNKTKRGPFGDALAEVDWMVGNIQETLERLGLDKNTLIIFTSDNGPWTIKGVDGGSAGPFVGSYATYKDTAKGSTWEGGIRMPSFAYWKGQIPPYSRSSETISSLDVFPTLSRLANVALPTNVTLDGRDMTDILLREQGKSKHDFLFFYGFCNGKWPRYGPTAVRHVSKVTLLI
jgi:arylsulfatase A